MLLNGVVDAGNVGEIVACIVLLLAMDAKTIGNKVRENAVDRELFVFSGQFCEVPSFVAMLVGESPYVQMDTTETDSESQECKLYDEWLQHWKDWKVGFSHFVNLLEKPAGDVLWKMLDRRAAGVLSRNQKGAALVIPIFCRDSRQASFILVKVKNRVEADKTFPDSALANLLPRSIFKKNHPLHAVADHEMIRLYMSLREQPTHDRPGQSVVTPGVAGIRSQSQKEEEATKPPPFSCSLCVRGMFAPTADADDGSQTLNEICERWPFLWVELIKQLRAIADSAWWDGKVQVDYDIDNREADQAQKCWRPLSRVLPKETALEVASKTLSLISSDERE